MAAKHEIATKVAESDDTEGVADEIVLAGETVIRNLIYTMRGTQVMLDSDLAVLYGVETRILNQAVTRNPERFPERFCFRLTKEEEDVLKSQIVTSSVDGWGGRRKPHRVFTEAGVSMLSAVLRSNTAVAVELVQATLVRVVAA